MLRINRTARTTFDALARTYRRHCIDRLASARRDETRARRLAEKLALLERDEELPLK